MQPLNAIIGQYFFSHLSFFLQVNAMNIKPNKSTGQSSHANTCPKNSLNSFRLLVKNKNARKEETKCANNNLFIYQFYFLILRF